jgi:opacity protein-like surface antigen
MMGLYINFEKNMVKKLTLTLLGILLLTPQAFATRAGWYIGANAGFGRYQLKEVTPIIATVPTKFTPKNDSPTIGVELGYNFSEYMAMGFGYNYFDRTTYSGDDSKLCSAPTTTHQSAVLFGKFMFPAEDNFNIFGKVGLALSTIKQSGVLDVVTVNAAGCDTNAINSDQFGFYLGAGVGFNLNQNTELGFSLNRISGEKESAVTYALLSISYHFVAERCGDFLC